MMEMRVGGLVTYSTGEPLKIARAAYERTRDAPSDREALQPGDPLLAIIFSAVALDAFINDAVTEASQRPHPGPFDRVKETVEVIESVKKKTGVPIRIINRESEPPVVRMFAGLVEEMGGVERVSTGSKFSLARFIFAGRPYDKGAPPYQDFALLMDLRGELLHLKPGEHDILFSAAAGTQFRRKRPAIIEGLRSKNILAEIEGPGAPLETLIRQVSTRASARWAYNTAVDMVASVIEVVPASELKRSLESYSKFRRVE